MVQVELSNCHQITSLPPLGRLKSLKKLSIKGLSGVKEVGVEFYEDESCFSCLETLEIVDMGEWEQWAWSNGLGEDSVAKFPKLYELQIQNCSRLVEKLPNFLSSLENIVIDNCPLLVELPKVLPSFITLYIRRCQEAFLKSVTNATCLTSLKRLEIGGCHELVSLVDGEEGLLPCNLEVLDIDLCPNLKELPSGLKDLKSLEDLKISQCRSLVSFPVGALPHNLIYLSMENCGSLESLPKGIFPDSLKHLNIHNCWTTQLLNSLYYGLSHLTDLEIWNCPQLELFSGKELPISSLVSLKIADCQGLRSLSNHMQNFQSLQKLEIGAVIN
uniref:NB-ARC domain-containing protein n=1 Tax=Manihot esculenta TaxID=3983 RepID=A0A2C9V6J1_MANES